MPTTFGKGKIGEFILYVECLDYPTDLDGMRDEQERIANAEEGIGKM
jgi:hypothetical protein